MKDKVVQEAAARLAGRGFNHGAVVRHAMAVEDRVPDPSNRGITEEEWAEANHLEKFGYAPMKGLSDVDYSDIEAEFDSLAKPSNIFTGLNPYDHLPDGFFGFVGLKEKGGALVAQAKRAEKRIYELNYKSGRNSRLVSRFGEGKVAKGFVDALHSVVRDVDVYDPRVEMDLYLKYMLIRTDFVGGQCHFCKHNTSYVMSVRGEDGFRYVYKCASCRINYGPKAGALFHNSRVHLPVIMDAVRMSLDTSGVSSPKMAKALGLSQKTTWALRHLIRNNSLMGDRWPYEQAGEAVAGHRAKPVLLKSLDELGQIAGI